MSRRAMCLATGLIVLLGGGRLALSAGAGGGFKLVSAVPDDVFVLTAVKHNPERQFVEDYWDEVIDTATSTGIGTDVMALIGSFLGDSQLQEVDRLKEKATRLIEGVDWKQLKGGEFVFAERMSRMDLSSGGVSVGPPDIVWLFRGKPGSASKNYDGLVAILKEIAVEINKAAQREVLAVDTTQRMGARVATLRSPEVGESVSFAIAVHNETVIAALGERMLEDVLGLMNGKGSTKPLSASPRFAQAFAKLGPAEDMMSFFDVQALLGSVRAIIDASVTAISSQMGAKRNDAPLGPEAGRLVTKATGAYVQKDYKQALVYTQKAHEVAPDNSMVMYNLACFHALVGNKDDALTWLDKAVDAGFYSPGKIAGDSDLESLRDDPRYKAAYAKAREKASSEGSQAADWVAVARRLTTRLMDVPGMVDYVAGVERTDGYSTHSNCNTVLVSGASDKPFYAVVGKRKPSAAFDRYLPKETVSFSVNAGIDLIALYKFIEDTIRETGSKGEQLLARWEAVQQEVGFNVRRDLLAWLESEMIRITLRQPMGDAQVFMLKVTDEALAREKLGVGLAAVSSGLQQAAQQNPMLAMMAMQVSPATHKDLPGFQNIVVGVSPQPAVLGVADGYAVFGTSADAVALCLATAAGKHPSIKQNPRVIGEALVPDGSYWSVSFTDKRKMGQEISEALAAVGMMGGMAVMAIPDPQAQQALTKVLQMLLKLGPVAKKIDFYKSSASYATFDGTVWNVRSVTNYKSPAERLAGAGVQP